MTVWPRDPEHRFHLYAVSQEERRVLAAAPSLEAVGVAIGTLFAEEEFGPTDRIGILDTRGSEEGSGVWVVNPWA